MKLKTELVSVSQTFVTTFVVELGIALKSLPEGTLGNPDFWKAGGALAILISVGRSVLKVVWNKYMPVKLGGLPKA